VIAKNRQLLLDGFFAAHPVFTREQFAHALGPTVGPAAVAARLSYYTRNGRLRSVARRVYAVVPAGEAAGAFRPDPFLVAHAARPDAIFSHHSALELLGAAHSAWSACTLFSAGERLSLRLDGSTIRFAPHPTALVQRGAIELGTRRVERRGAMLRATGPERTLIEGFRQLTLVGGVAELVASAAGFGALDLALIEELLERYAVRRLWAAVGWFLENHAQAFGVTERDVARFERHRPKSPLYLARGLRGGAMVARWNLVLPPDVGRGDPDAGES
jgi:predicted transcriptional regulator of viral defense system